MDAFLFLEEKNKQSFNHLASDKISGYSLKKKVITSWG